MKTTAAWTVAVLVIMACAGCSPESGWGFTLPEGDIDNGKATYVEMQCHTCHRISGVDQLAVEGQDPEISVALGGEVSRIKTYGELVTAIINPSHRLASGYPQEMVAENGVSKMKSYNDVMTVTQLTDLVSFLQSNYELREYEATDYPMY